MSSIDGGLSSVLRTYLPPEAHMQRIETGGVGLGIPDCNVCLRGVEVWLELKMTTAFAVAIRPEQVGWAERRSRAGGRVFMLTRRTATGGPRKGPPVDEIWIHRAEDIRLVKQVGLRDAPPPLYRGDGGPARWEWDRVVYWLFRHPMRTVVPAWPIDARIG